MWNGADNEEADLPTALNAHVFEDASGVSGQIAIDLGRACNQLPVLADWSAYQTILQQKPGGHEKMVEISATKYEIAEEFIAETMAPMANARMKCTDAEIAADEFGVAAALMRHACHLGKARLRALGRDLPALPGGWGISHILPQNKSAAERAAEKCYYWPDRPGDDEIPRFDCGDLRSLAEEMEGLVEAYRRVWLARNRQGGLDESVARFICLLALYRTNEQGVSTGP